MMVQDPAPVLATTTVPTMVPAAPSDEPEKALSDWQAVDDAAAVVVVELLVLVDECTAVVEFSFGAVDGLEGEELQAAASRPNSAAPMIPITRRVRDLIR
jgi:hypothetical protein